MAGQPKIRFDPLSGVPAVRQIAEGIRVLLVNRDLTVGDTLPSIRRLAIELGVHFNTVADAYRELAGEGWLDLQHGRGAVVLERSTPKMTGQDWLEDFRSKLRNLVAQMRADGAPGDQIAAELRDMAKVIAR
ncbi:GntR family transcriptional regulator [Nevskia soli]|uniref:GntR family transcriptional regulator n=1 Tax=Nevskia soli TaxID=418856 RepID=UPI0015D6EA76|nr:GntR family transcriptional regulator [Nevskia soli]